MITPPFANDVISSIGPLSSLTVDAITDFLSDHSLRYQIGRWLLRERNDLKAGIYDVLDTLCEFDIDDEDAMLARSAKSWHRHRSYEAWARRGIDKLRSEGVAAFISKDRSLLMFAHPSSKQPGSYQVTTFSESVGPLGDTQHRSIEEIFKAGCIGAGIGRHYRFIPAADLESLVQTYATHG